MMGPIAQEPTNYLDHGLPRIVMALEFQADAHFREHSGHGLIVFANWQAADEKWRDKK